MTTTRWTWWLALVAAGLLAAPFAPAQETEPAPPEKQPEKEEPEKEAAEKQPGEEEALPSLDELLDLEEEDEPEEAADGEETEEPLDPEKRDLERALDATQVSELFEQAVRQMADVAQRLERARDPGLTTQREQEEIIKKLDKLVEEAERRASQRQSQSSSQSQSQGQQQQQPPSQQQQGSQRTQGSQSQGEMTPPGRQEERLAEALDAAKAAWGALPPRVRDALTQGFDERYSTLYESMTEEYYRRLAEEPEGEPQ